MSKENKSVKKSPNFTKRFPNLRFPGFEGEWTFVFGNEIFANISNKNHNSDLPVLAITQEFGAIPRDLIDFKISVTDKSIVGYKVVDKGDFIISLRSFQGGIEYSQYQGICSPAYIILKPKIKIVNDFYKYYLKTTRYITLLNKKLEGIRDGKMISYQYFSEIPLPIPEIDEQQKLSQFLILIDEKLQAQKKTIEDLIKLRKEIFSQIVLQKIRFKDIDNKLFTDWSEVELKEFLFQKNKRNKSLKNTLVLSVNNKKGFVTQEEQFDGYEVASKDLSNYKVVNKNDIAYNPSRINVGSIAILKNFESGIVSPMYVVFEMKGNLDSRYFLNLFQTQEFKYKIKSSCAGSVRESLNFNDLQQFEILLPSIEEQRKIASFIETMDSKIELETQILEKLNLQKKFFLQNLFI